MIVKRLSPCVKIKLRLKIYEKAHYQHIQAQIYKLSDLLLYNTNELTNLLLEPFRSLITISNIRDILFN